MNTADLPLQIIPLGHPLRRATLLLLAGVLMGAGPMYWLLLDAQHRSDALLVDAVARNVDKPSRVTIEWVSGGKTKVSVNQREQR